MTDATEQYGFTPEELAYLRRRYDFVYRYYQPRVRRLGAFVGVIVALLAAALVPATGMPLLYWAVPVVGLVAAYGYTRLRGRQIQHIMAAESLSIPEGFSFAEEMAAGGPAQRPLWEPYSGVGSFSASDTSISIGAVASGGVTDPEG